MLNVIVSLQQYLSTALRRDDRGATAVEYGLLVALIAAVIIAAVVLLGNNISTIFNNVATTIGGA
jgi:pilus assembly protein Flp/PilA